MHIEVINNCSTQSDIEAVIRTSLNRVFYIQTHNAGLVANFTTYIQRAHDHLVHILHDDTVLPKFCSRLQQAFESKPTVGAAFCHVYVNESNRQRYLLPPKELHPASFPPSWSELLLNN